MIPSMENTTVEQKHSVLLNEIPQVWRIAWPLILTNLLSVTVGIVDLKMVGTLGFESIAAVGMSRQVTMFIMVLMIAINGGSSVMVARAYGSGDQGLVTAIASRCVVYISVSALAFVTPAGLLLSKSFLVALGGSDEVVRLGTSYL